MSVPREKLQLWAAFAIVYLVWGSTYLAIRIGVEDLPPALLAGVRFTVAGLIIGALALARGQQPSRSLRQWRHALVMGLAMVVIGNGLVTWAEIWVPSNQAALLITSGALFTAGFGTLGPRGHQLTIRSMLGLGVGFLGVILLFWPEEGYVRGFLLAQSAIIVAAMSWAGGTTYARNYVTIDVEPMMFAAMQMLTGGLILLAIALAAPGNGEWHWTWPGFFALAYLTLFGSCLAYATYFWLIRHTTPDRLGTIAYVNPLVATVLGWWWLDERLGGLQLVGMAVIVAGVLLVNLPVRRHRPVPG